MNMTSEETKEKLKAFILGLFVLLLFIEFSLQLSSFFFGVSMNEKFSEGFEKPPEDQYNVLCLGNSHTAGGKNSYPSKLEGILNRSLEGNINVFNGGIGQLNSFELLNNLEEVIDRTNPDLIVLRIGQCNRWNHIGYSNFLERKNNSTLPEEVSSGIFGLMYNLRLFRLLNLLKHFFSVNERENRDKLFHNMYKEDEIFLEFKKEYSEEIMNFREFKIEFYNQNKSILRQYNLSELKKTFREAIDKYPKIPKGYRYLAEIYLMEEDYEKAVKISIQGIKANSDYRDSSEMNMNYVSLRKCSKRTKNESLKEKINRFLRDMKKNSYKNYLNLVHLEDEELKSWLESDMYKIIRIINSRDIDLIIHNYHTFPRNMTPHIVNCILEKKAEGYEVPFVDNYALFRDLIGRPEYDYRHYRKINGVPEQHLNGKGNKIIAKNIYERIIREHLVNSEIS